MNIEHTGYSRKIESVGRIGIPIEIRRKYGMDQGKEYSYNIISYEGKEYLGLELGERVKSPEELQAIIKQLQAQINNQD